LTDIPEVLTATNIRVVMKVVKHLRNSSQYLPEYMAQHPRRQPSSNSNVDNEPWHSRNSQTLWNPKVQYCVHESPSLVPVLS
jgi:hypothetical protein